MFLGMFAMNRLCRADWERERCQSIGSSNIELYASSEEIRAAAMSF
jgi:hypothetical protein